MANLNQENEGLRSGHQELQMQMEQQDAQASA